MKNVPNKLIYIVMLIVLNACHYNTPPPETPIRTLGHYLFFDNRLSANSTKACASCHAPQFAFSDGYKRSLGIKADLTPRNAPSLINTAYFTRLNWANPEIHNFEEQMVHPLFNVVPLEMGAVQSDNTIPNRIAEDDMYQKLFKEAFPKEKQPVTWDNIIKAIGTYCRTLTSTKSPYDSYVNGDTNAISPAAKRGESLFFSHKLKCMACHTPPFFTSATDTIMEDLYVNVGLYEKYPDLDQGLYDVTNKEEDKGKFRVPSLRNIGFTAPYMHDGSVASLKEVLDMYTHGGRIMDYGEQKGDGSKHPNRDRRVHGFRISEEEKQDIISFLLTLNDSSVLTKPEFQDPFKSKKDK